MVCAFGGGEYSEVYLRNQGVRVGLIHEMAMAYHMNPSSKVCLCIGTLTRLVVISKCIKLVKIISIMGLFTIVIQNVR